MSISTACRHPAAPGLLLALALLVSAGTARAALSEPRWTLDRPDGAGQIFVAAHGSLGATYGYDLPRPGAGISLIFRPRAASELFGPLYAWNTGLVLQGEWRSVASDRRLFGLALLARRYLADRRGEALGASPFVGIGAGGAQGNAPDRDPVRSWLWLAEAGWEKSPSPGSVFFARVQLHVWRGGGLVYSGWSLQLGAGVPVPW